MKKILSVLALSVLVTGCTHQKIDVAQVGDRDLSCTEITRQLASLDNMEGEIDEKTGFSGRNVGMALLFWPGVIVNEMNAGDAEDRIRDRKEKLVAIYDDKSC